VSRLHVVGMDPAFGGGVRGQTEAFLDGARALGRDPVMHYALHPTFGGPARDHTGTRVPLGHVDSLNRVLAGRRIAPQLGDPVWVVATTAPYGYPALRSRLRYACWLGAGVSEESAARSNGLARSRRLALRLNEPLLRRLEREVISGATAVYATGPSSRAEVARAGGLDEREVGILPIPVDLERFSPAPEDPDLEQPLLVFVGRADDPRKNVHLLLDALPLLRKRFPGARLRLVGAPPRAALPDGAEATGPVDSVADQLREAALFVLPSRHEGFGIAAAEALAAGVPVLTTPCGGSEHLVRQSGAGAVLAGFTPEELADTAASLLGDAASLSEMRRRGREHVEREHSPERFRELLAHALDH
jgi:glycosyltransferase involved in cell wall biosynthesis